MGKYWTLVIIGMINIGLLNAEFNRPVTSLDLWTGYRRDNFHWGINHDIELDGKTSSCSSSESSSSSDSCFEDCTLYRAYWKNLQIYELGARGSYTGCNNYYIRVNGNYGWIYDGRNRLSANTSSSRPGDETSRIKGDCNRGHVADIQGGVGYSFTSNWRRCIVTPIVGWSYNEMSLFLQNPKQTINYSDAPPLLGNIPNLSYRYKPRWYGFWAGADVLVSVETPCVLLFGSFEYHWAQYHAKGRWNFMDRFVDTYSHRSNGKGFVGYLGFNYRLCRSWYVGIQGAYRNLQFQKGKHKTLRLVNDLANPDMAFGTMPEIPLGTHTHIRRIRWSSWSVSLTLTYRWWIWDQ